MTLSSEQQAAVYSDAPRILLRAGAGSGKTRVLVERVARLLEANWHPAEVLCLTFTRAAAAEMRERLALRCPGRSLRRLTITTFHAWAARLMREYHELLDLPPNFTVRDEQDRDDLVAAIGGQLALKWKSTRRLWQEDVVRDRYRQMLREVSAVDFDGLQLDLGRLLRSPGVTARLRRRWPHVLVDETQDNDPKQWAVLDALAPAHLFVVGDHAQSIYGFRGASPAGFTERAAAEGWTPLELRTNYRSTPQIVVAANEIAALMEPAGIAMVAARGDGAPVATSARDDLTAELHAGRLAGRAWSDCAILAPTWKRLEEAATSLAAAGIPHRLARTIPDVWESPEMRWLMQCRRAAANPSDHLSLLSALNAFAVRMPLGEWAAVRAAALSDGRSCLEVLRERRPASCSWIVEALDGDLDGLRLALADELARLHLDTRAEYMRGPVDEALARFNGEHEDGLAGLLDWYATRHLDAEPKAADAPDEVTLTTIHGAKGLEWPCVWILDGDRWERWHGEAAEKRRLLYVATTRSRDSLTFVSLPEAPNA